MAAALGSGGYIFVNYVFKTAMEREVGQAMDENSILQFAFETAALNIPSKYDVLRDSAIEQICSNLEKGQNTGRLMRLSDEDKKVLYVSDGFTEDLTLLEQIDERTRIYQVIQLGQRYYIQTGTVLSAMDRILYLETMKDVTGIYEERSQGFLMYRRITLIMLSCSAVVMFFISFWLTRPIRYLTKATRKMAEGDYSYRARQISNDEMGDLTCDYNMMANALEENIHKLEEEIQAREEFVAAFSHELKTPLTAIIGYADMLRSRKLDEEKQFLSANYIYTEGKRLETMAFRLLDIIVTRKEQITLQKIEVQQLFDYLQDIYAKRTDMKFSFYYDAGVIKGESNLLKTVMINLIDNAIKASEAGQCIEVAGRQEENGYRFWVKDEGMGIPEEECKKITEAFYMVDKSRSRSRNGAGLGLALCTSILELHHSKLEIQSIVGKGSVIGFIIGKEVAAGEKN